MALTKRFYEILAECCQTGTGFAPNHLRREAEATSSSAHE